MRASNPQGLVKKYQDPNNPLSGFTNEPAANYKIGLYSGHFVRNGQSFARKAVFFERRLELAMEHHRFFDMVRLAGINSAGFDIAKHFNSFMRREGSEILNPTNVYLEGVFIKNKNELLPIPQSQIDLSFKDGKSVLTQNPGY